MTDSDWRRKRLVNRRRDRQVDRMLRKSGWRVLRIWEHELRDESRVAARVRRVVKGRGLRAKG